LVIRPLLVRVVRARDGRGPISTAALSAVVVGLLLSALVTETIGIHALFGAFLFGAVLPHDSDLARDVHDKLSSLVVVLFLPAFFAFTGMRTQIGLVDGAAQWALCGLVVLTATVGKFGGAFVAARFSGLTTRDAAALGVLMNTRGLMELVVLNVGLDLGVVSPVLFAMMVLMALATTFGTTPALALLARAPARAS
jgi:Kef-type K+ transport system membrane component KefB